ncbi:heavy-metal-associated domain-containing protein [Enhygromyxa salina]|uniref:Copper chaperone CopZ n=1 Tax=Enhygromyxa salina TaxID=215803 RepID=A0A2S9YFN9_9BACT|nr:heavy metal-associated domain-containing protein [Enhygromyxa salina]PRQ03920.1 Copper chaperone CopZ [Enhygromyxa salina]
MNTTTLQVSGMTCGSCIEHIERALADLRDVQDTEVDLANGVVRICHTDAVTADQLAARISAAGYPSRAVAAA